MRHKQDDGFTLIELLVVIVIIGILSAIAIPVFLTQREKAARSAVESDLRNAATALVGIAVEPKGNYSDLNGKTQDAPQLRAQGFNPSEGVTFTIVSDSSNWCLQGSSSKLPDQQFVLRSKNGIVQQGTAAEVSCAGS